ncbi:hypothetical protein Tco_0387524, partial [Tanacetum coccineum]
MGANGLTSPRVNGYLVKAHQTHSCSCDDPVAVHVSMLSFLLLLQSSEVCFWKRVPAGSVVPTGKDSSIVSTGSTKVIPTGNTILVL